MASSTLDTPRTASALAGSQHARPTSDTDADLPLAAPSSSDPQALINRLIETNTHLARSIAVRYRNRGIDLDDLEQVALWG